MERFHNKVALITGGTSGIGLATAQRFANEGAQIVIANRNLQKTETIIQQLASKGYKAKAVYFNATEASSGIEAVKQTIDMFGKIDCLINNVGGTDMQRDGSVSELTPEYFEEIFQLNLKSMLYTIRAALPSMIEHKSGNIVNVASIGGITGDFRGTLYGMTKAGVINLTRYTATQYGKYGIRCNGVAPGLVVTPAVTDNLPTQIQEIFLKHNALPYLGNAEDIAATIAFLASNDARYITGQTIVADGGMTCHNPTVGDLEELV